MADPLTALGAAAASLQLVELGAKIIKSTYDLYAAIQEAPEQTQKRLVQIQQLIDIAGLIAKNEALQKQSVASILGSCLGYAREFHGLLLKVNAGDGDGWLKRKRKAVEAVMKEKKVGELFVNLEREKTSLALSIVEVDSSLLRSIGIDIDDLKTTLGDVSVVVRGTAEGVEGIAGDVSEVKTMLLTMNQKVSEPSPIRPRSFYLVPNRRARNFVGRETVLDQINASFSLEPGPHVVVLRGLGGQGKTQISLEYCRRTREKKFRSFFWIDANSETTVKKSFETVAEKIKDPGESVPESATIDFTLDKLREWEDNWLMVFDNYDDVENFENIQDFIPDSERGCIIITSRHSDSMSLATKPENAIDLLGLAQVEALELLYRTCEVKETESTTPNATAIVDRLVCHPLAITQAGSYIKKRRIPLDKFLDDYNRRTKDILQHTPQLTQYRRSLNDSQRETSLNVFTTWELSFEQLLKSPSSGQHSAGLLTLFAFFDCNDITEHLFSAYCTMSQQYPKHYLWPVLYLEACLDGESKWDSDSYRDILIDLANLSLLQSWSVGDDGFCHCSLHPLVQDWIRLRTGPEDLRNCVRTAAKVLEATLRECWRQRSFDLKLSVRQPLLSHISMYQENRRMIELEAKDKNAVFDDTFHQTEDRIALFLANTGRYDEAIAIQTKVVGSIEVTFGPEHPNTLSYINNLANFYVEQGKYDLAEPMLRRVHESRERSLGPGHSDTLLSLYNLANLLRSTAKFEAAEEMARRALAGREELLGPEHPDTLRSLSALAGILRLQDKYKEAEQYARRALEGREKVLGPNHNDTLMSVGILGTILWGQWRLHAAERMIRRELEGKENVLGREHPETLRAIGNLGNILKDQGKLDDAEKMTRRALEGMEKLLGKEHSSTLISVWNLAVVKAEQKEYAGANILYQRACSGFLKTLGDSNATKIRCLKEYERMLEKMKTKSILASGVVPLE